ncbi:class I SAM-dependent methyltransferase [Paenibacillaceae bacterium WGS1546]|uniref:class I SAM-dependent methyltransferase n=1 Tax=Cohnella sp. WGS1546 TaxID=3366810 RepID=UPI00372D685C
MASVDGNTNRKDDWERNERQPKQKVHWEAHDYDRTMKFVSKYGEDLVTWLNPKPGERIVDFGCGTGDLAARIASAGADVTGVDISPEMVERARAKYPGLRFELADGTKWSANEPFDAVFSNAALHWMKDAEGAAASLSGALRPGGRFVAEFGGFGNVATIIAAVRETMRAHGRESEFAIPWYFPTVGEYASLLERYGMEVRTASLFNRPTTLAGEAEGMREWLRMFGTAMFPSANAADAERWIAEATDRLKSTLFDGERWTADYRRLRVIAFRK